VLKAYFDESERNEGLLCVAGYAFAPHQASKFAKEFESVFGKYGGFHMKELVHRKKAYKGISEAERTELIREAVRIVCDRFSYGVAVTVDIREYLTFAPRFIRGFGQAYPFLCHLGMFAMADLAKKNGDFRPISYFFESGHAYASEAASIVNQLGSIPESQALLSYRTSSFVPKSGAVPLQAADLLAWVGFGAQTASRQGRLLSQLGNLESLEGAASFASKANNVTAAISAGYDIYKCVTTP